MLRFAVISTFILAACDVGELPGTGTDGGGSGGGGDGGGSGSNCETVAASPPDGHHNPGVGCRTGGGCHNAALGLGNGAPEFSIAGTVYRDTAGTMPYAGATVLVEIAGQTHKSIAGNNGNFWFVPALTPSPTNAMTGKTSASACPNTAPMIGSIVGGGGDCNNCHRNGGQTLPIYVLP